MPLKPARRNYNCSDADLKAAADQIVNCATRDIADFSSYNVDADDVTAFQASITNFFNKTTDDESLGDQKTETDAKNSLRKDIEETLRLVRTAAQLKYGGQGKYRKFGFDGFTNLSDNDFVRMVRRVVRVLTDLQTEMTSSFPSVNDKIITLTTKGDELDNAVDLIIDKKNARDIATQNRIIAGNTVYVGLFKLSSIGKTLYQDTDEAKYNDYVLGFQGSTPGVPGEPEGPTTKVDGSVIKASNSTPIPGVHVTVVAGTQTFSGTCDSNGNFSITTPAEGNVQVSFKKDGYNDFQTICTLVQGNTTHLPGVKMVVYTVIKGFIETQDTLIRIAGVDIRAEKNDDTGMVFNTTTDSNGEYILEVEPGNYWLIVDKPGYQTASQSPFDIAEGQTVNLSYTLAVEPPVPQGISGHIRNASNNVPISGVLVKDLIIPDLSTTTDDNGYFFYNAPDSFLDSTHHVSLQLQFSKTGFVTYQMPEPVSIGQSNRLLLDTLTLTPAH